MVAMQRAVTFLQMLLACMIVSLGTVLALKAGWFDPVPYRDVEVIDLRRDGDNHLFVHLAYIKTEADCEYVRGQAFAMVPGGREPVAFTPIRVGGQESQRFVGHQDLRWEIDLLQWRPDQVQIWTRHDCRGTRVDRLMATVEVPE